ncbi:acyltransferase family protein [Paenarthrobacter nicotinovorans]|uniref:acyltransferase family protein n=1 Tax=Paenarthrobacter nicotinovorans TaxID=29320 RepID=UPI00166EF2D8|nr:acyltransferase [Paenarthrobacter nicotinovorans]UKE98314.1 acyltransferase [Paenarthrobacter nicotinovorans]UKF03101.1 acyltransferase [Paenarthrobacter nicotinovorans]
MAQSTLTKSSLSSQRARKPSSKRLDIHGLRAVAVLAVVANHLTGLPGGGFVGVDVFFVISGFVITLGLMREHEMKGTISFRDFYVRRVARILPASTATIVITVTASYFVFFAARASGVLQDGVWALLFSANWRFASSGTDYWAEDSPISSLQHYWSLGVEEQFYFVWPWVLVLVLGIAAKFGASALRRRYAPSDRSLRSRACFVSLGDGRDRNPRTLGLFFDGFPRMGAWRWSATCRHCAHVQYHWANASICPGVDWRGRRGAEPRYYR